MFMVLFFYWTGVLVWSISLLYLIGLIIVYFFTQERAISNISSVEDEIAKRHSIPKRMKR